MLNVCMYFYDLTFTFKSLRPKESAAAFRTDVLLALL